MHLHDLGWNDFFETQLAELTAAALVPARVTAESKGFYCVRTAEEEYLAGIAGKIRYEAEGRRDLPVVGDWVGIAQYPQGRARIECILPRRTSLSRKAAGRGLSEQVIASNLDTVFVVSALNRDFNLRRIERYLALVWDSGAHPVLLLNKADLCADTAGCIGAVEKIAFGAPVHALSALTGTGLNNLRACLVREQTAAFVGSSGAGKSTIINALVGNHSLPVQAVRGGDDRGRHTTTSRQMIFLPGGGLVIDTPGMRELGLWDNQAGVARAFDDIATLAQDCRFRDCSHHGEPGCAVEAAIGNGELEPERLTSHHKLQAELRFQERRVDPRAARQEKDRWKRIHRSMRARSRPR